MDSESLLHSYFEAQMIRQALYFICLPLIGWSGYQGSMVILTGLRNRVLLEREFLLVAGWSLLLSFASFSFFVYAVPVCACNFTVSGNGCAQACHFSLFTWDYIKGYFGGLL